MIKPEDDKTGENLLGRSDLDLNPFSNLAITKNICENLADLLFPK